MTPNHALHRPRKRPGPRKSRRKIQYNIELDLLEIVQMLETSPDWFLRNHHGQRSNIINQYLRAGLIARGVLVVDKCVDSDTIQVSKSF